MAVEGSFVLTLRDYGTQFEKSTVTMPVPVMNAGNLVAQTALLDTLKDAIGVITLGGFTRDVRQNFEALSPNAGLIPPEAQRENKWMVTYSDNITGKNARVEIPTLAFALMDPSGDKADPTDVGILAFIAAFEAVVLGPDGNSCEVIAMTYVARNL